MAYPLDLPLVTSHAETRRAPCWMLHDEEWSSVEVLAMGHRFPVAPMDEPNSTVTYCQ